MKNVRNALLMFNWKGDIGWFNGAPEYPMLDIFTGAFLILGAAAWLVRCSNRAIRSSGFFRWSF